MHNCDISGIARDIGSFTNKLISQNENTITSETGFLSSYLISIFSTIEIVSGLFWGNSH